MKIVLQFVLALALALSPSLSAAQAGLGERLLAAARRQWAANVDASAAMRVEAPADASLPCGGDQLILEHLLRIGAHRWQFSARCPGGRPVLARLETPVELHARGGAHASTSAPSARPTPLVRAGQRATLEIDMQGMRLTLTVTALEKGALGDSIRVRSMDGRREFTARIVRADLLRIAPAQGGQS